VPAILSDPLMAVTYDLVADKNAAPALIRLPRMVTADELEQIATWPRYYKAGAMYMRHGSHSTDLAADARFSDAQTPKFFELTMPHVRGVSAGPYLCICGATVNSHFLFCSRIAVSHCCKAGPCVARQGHVHEAIAHALQIWQLVPGVLGTGNTA
jgi:hypothetical protein